MLSKTRIISFASYLYNDINKLKEGVQVMATSKSITQDRKKIIMWALCAGLAAVVAILFAVANGASKADDVPDESASSSIAASSEDTSEEVDAAPDVSSPTYYYDQVEEGMSEGEVDSLLSTYHKYEEPSSSYGGQTAKMVRYTDSGSTFVITYMNGIVSAKAR